MVLEEKGRGYPSLLFFFSAMYIFYDPRTSFLKGDKVLTISRADKHVVCENHPESSAIYHVVQEKDGITDVSELCSECYSAFLSAQQDERSYIEQCDYCKKEVEGCTNYQDHEEGSSGPVYRVCAACREQRNKEIAAFYDDIMPEDFPFNADFEGWEEDPD